MIIYAIVVMIKLPISFRRTAITAWIVGKSEPILIFKTDLIGTETHGILSSTSAIALLLNRGSLPAFETTSI